MFVLYRLLGLHKDTGKRLQRQVEEQLEEEQAAFRPGRQIQDWIYSLRAINEKRTSRGRTLNLAFLDLKSAFHRVPRIEIWNTLEKWGISLKKNKQKVCKNIINNITYKSGTLGLLMIYVILTFYFSVKVLALILWSYGVLDLSYTLLLSANL